MIIIASTSLVLVGSYMLLGGPRAGRLERILGALALGLMLGITSGILILLICGGQDAVVTLIKP